MEPEPAYYVKHHRGRWRANPKRLAAWSAMAFVFALWATVASTPGDSPALIVALFVLWLVPAGYLIWRGRVAARGATSRSSSSPGSWPPPGPPAP